MLVFYIQHELGPWAKEKQYCDVIERKLRENNIPFVREFPLGSRGNITDFMVDNKIILELKAKRIILRDDYVQTQRYLQQAQVKLAILVNFRSKFIKPIRVVKIDLE